MKALLLLPRELNITSISEKLAPVERLLGRDSLYAVITSDRKHIIDSFPELIYILNETGNLLYGIYKGLKKLRGNDVFVADIGFEHSIDTIKQFLRARRQNLLHAVNGGWRGLALLRLIDLDYVIRTLESSLDNTTQDFAQIIQFARAEYGIEYDLV
ncbi:MAG: hypothetical protein ABDH18_01575 [Aquificaceae bacterium]